MKIKLLFILLSLFSFQSGAFFDFDEDEDFVAKEDLLLIRNLLVQILFTQ